MPGINTIRFPKMHIAQSTANRILNIAAGLPDVAPATARPPVLPDLGTQDQALTAQLETPPAPAELPPGADGAVVQASLLGDDLGAAALDPLLADQ